MSLRDKTVFEITTVNPLNKEYYYTDLILPASKSEIEDTLQKARVKGAENKWHDIYAINSPYLPELADTRLDAPTIDELNFFAKRVQQLSEKELFALSGIFINEKDQGEFEDGVTMKHLINLTYGLEGVVVVDGIKSDEELGEFVIENDLEEFILDMPEEGIKYLNKAEVGKEHRGREGGIYVDGRYIATDTYSYPEPYDGFTIPKENYPEYGDGVFMLKIAKAPGSDEEAELCEQNGKWISLPMTEDEINAAKDDIGVNSIEECVFYGFKSGMPEIDDEFFGDMKYFDLLNKIALQYSEMNELGRIKYKAVLQKEEPQTLQRILDLSERIEEYDLSYYCDCKESFAEVYLAYHLPTGFDPEYLDSLPLARFGERIMEGLNANLTDYGVISERGGNLMALVPYRQEQGITQSNDQEMGGMQM